MSQNSPLRVIIVPVTPLQQNCSLIWNTETGQGAIVDPGGDLERLKQAIAANKITLEKILVTHAHLDHAGGVADLAKFFGVPIEGPHPEDQFWIDRIEESGRQYGVPNCKSFVPDRWLEDGDSVAAAGETFEVVHCPGHTPGHVVFFHRGLKLAFVGDVLFRGSIGRTDFPRGNHQDLIDSITGKLWPLGDEVTFVPGHGPTSTFGQERQSNPFVGDRALSMTPLLLVFAAGLLAGGMNALAGGGSFVTLPALIAAGVPSVQANASSTVALLPGGAASAWAYRDGLGPVGSASLRSLMIVTLLGGVSGALLLLWTPTRLFDFLLPWLLLLATTVLTFGKRLGEALRRRWRIGPATVLPIQFTLGIYGGYFGGAVGIMMMAVWGLLDSRDVKSLNAPRTLLVTVANSLAALIFIIARAVHWRETVVMLAASAIGGYCGAQIGRRAPASIVRAGTLILTACITLAFFVKTYWGSSS